MADLNGGIQQDMGIMTDAASVLISKAITIHPVKNINQQNYCVIFLDGLKNLGLEV
jgi:hypothetical protein